MNNNLFHGDLVTSERILYTPSGFAKTYLVHLQEIGRLEARRPHQSRRDNLSSYLFFMVLHGAGQLSYLGQTHPLTAGDCVFIDCQNGYSHLSSNDLWTLQWVHLYGPSLEGIYEKYVERGGSPVFRPQSLDGFATLWQQLFDTAASTDFIRDMRLNEGLTRLLTLLMEQSWHPDRAQPQTKKQGLHHVRLYLEQHYAERISLDQLSEQFFMNKYYLAHLFKEQFGYTVLEYLQRVRITQAKQLLRFSNMSMEDIAAACGLSDANYLSRVFKKIEGIPPTEYRKRW